MKSKDTNDRKKNITTEKAVDKRLQNLKLQLRNQNEALKAFLKHFLKADKPDIPDKHKNHNYGS